MRNKPDTAPSGPRLAREHPQDQEQHHALEASLVQLRRMARRPNRRHWERSSPRARSVARPHSSPLMKLPMRPAPSPSGHERGEEIGYVEPVPLAAPREPQHGQDHAQKSAMEGHAALPDVEDLDRVVQVLGELVEQARSPDGRPAPPRSRNRTADRRGPCRSSPGPGAGLMRSRPSSTPATKATRYIRPYQRMAIGPSWMATGRTGDGRTCRLRSWRDVDYTEVRPRTSRRPCAQGFSR